MARSRTRRDRHMVREPLALHVVTVGPEACEPHPVSGWWSRGFGCMVAALGSRRSVVPPVAQRLLHLPNGDRHQR